MAILIPNFSQFTLPTTQATSRPSNPLERPASEPQDSVSLGGGVSEFPGFPKPFAGVGGIVGGLVNAQRPKTMAELDQEAADQINQGTQNVLDLRERPIGTGAGGSITNFAQNAQDQQRFIADMRGAQSIQRQTELALREKKAPDNQLTRAALARRQEVMPHEFKTGQGVITNFTIQAYEQQKQLIAKAEKEGWPEPKAEAPKAPTTQPAQDYRMNAKYWM